MLEYWKTHEQFVSKPEYLFLRNQKTKICSHGFRRIVIYFERH